MRSKLATVMAKQIRDHLRNVQKALPPCVKQIYGRGFDCVEISPRWPAAGIEEAEVSVGYECSERGIAYQVRVLPDKIVLTVDADGSEAGLHVLLPAGAEPRAVRCNGHDVPFHAVTVEQSRYADFDAAVRGTAQFEIPFR